MERAFSNRLLRFGWGGLVLVLSCHGPATRAEDLLEVLSLGMSHDARWASARAAHDAGLEKEKQGSAGLLPSVNLSGSYQSNDSDITYRGTTSFPSGEHRYDSADYGINVTHPLYRRQNYAAWQQSRTQATLAGEQLNLARVDLMLRIASAYFEQLTAQETVNLSEAEIAALSEQLDQAKAQFEAGASAVTDLFDTQARYDLAKAKAVAARNDLLAKQQALRRITDKPLPFLAAVRKEIDLPAPDPNTEEEWVAIAHEKSAQIRTYAGTRRVSEWEVERAQGAHYPVLDLVAGYSRNRSSGSVYTSVGSTMDTLSAGIRLQIPIFTGGDATSRVREAVANLEKASQDLEDTRRDIENQSRLSFQALGNGRSQIQALERALESNEKLLESSALGRRAGLRTTTDVLNAQQQLFSIRRDLSKARYDYLLNLLKLKGVSGMLNEDDFRDINVLLAGNNPPDTE